MSRDNWSRETTQVAEENIRTPDMSTNRGLYPHAGTPYPHSLARGWRTQTGQAGSSSVGVQQLAKGPDVSSEIVVVGHLALDLLAAV